MRHQFHGGFPRQSRHACEPGFSHALRQGEEIVGRPVSSCHPPVQRPPIKPVQQALLANRKTERAPDPLPFRDRGCQQHTQAEVKMLMPVEMGWRSVIETNEFLQLEVEYRTECSTQKRVRHKTRVARSLQKVRQRSLLVQNRTLYT